MIDSTQISTFQYLHLAMTLGGVLGILSVIIAIAYPRIERWRFSKIENRMIELKTKNKRE